MDKKRVGQIKEQFDLVTHNDETAKVEFWYARELMPLLGYERWENFDKAIIVRLRKWFLWAVVHIDLLKIIC